MLPRPEPLRWPTPGVVDVWDVDLASAPRIPLAELLARYLGCPVEAVAIARGEFGKPYLVSASGLRFSVTHSRDRGLVAVIADREVGVDLEEIRPRRRAAGMARRWLSDAEHRYLDAHAPDAWLAAFHQVWTVKEACVKASGLGLQALGATDVLLPPRGGARPWSDTADRQWSVRTLDVGSGWAAAVAVAVAAGAGRRPAVRLRRL